MESQPSKLSLSLLPIFLWISCHFYVVDVDAIFNPYTKPIISSCTGADHVCVVFDTKQMKCWGYGLAFGVSSNYGGTPSTVGDNIPYFNPGASLSIEKVSCPGGGTCVLLNTGDVKCVGFNEYGEAGIGVMTELIGTSTGYVGDSLPVVDLGNNVTVANVAGGETHRCALTIEGKVKCFGGNYAGQLGYGDKTNRGSSSSDMGDNLPYIDFGTNVTVASVHSGSSADHSCVILSAPAHYEQKIKCWGHNEYYQLGYGDTNSRGDKPGEMGDNLTVVDLGTQSRVKQIAFGTAYTCALLLDDSLKCYGVGSHGKAGYGQLGSGSDEDITSTGNAMPSVLIDSGKTVKFVTAGYLHTCILHDDMISMKCFGQNYAGQLGQGDQINRGNTPETMIPFIPNIDLGTGALKIQSIHSSYSFNCALFEDNSIKCFGDNYYGQFAIGSTQQIGDEPGELGSNLQFAELFTPTQSPTPPTLSPTHGPTRGPSSSPSRSPTLPTKSPTLFPTSLPTPTMPIISFCTGSGYSCAIFDSKQIKCWGQKIGWGLSDNPNDNLGDDITELEGAIPFINFGTNVAVDKVSCGSNHMCIKTEVGEMKCIGGNTEGQIGLEVQTTPIGEVSGHIGDYLPALSLGGGLQVLDIALGLSHSCVLFTNNKVKCFGRNYVGELGLGDTNNRGSDYGHMGDDLPYSGFGAGVEVASIHSGAMASHNCIILSAPANVAQRIKCWGYNGSYQLDYGDINNRGDQPYEMGDNLPLVEFGNESRVKQLAIGGAHTCALLLDDTLKCFGHGGYGQLGSGSTQPIKSTGISLPTVTIDDGKEVLLVSAGTFHTCIVYDDRITMKCFGENSYAQLGQGDATNRGNTPETMLHLIPSIDLGTGTLKIASIHGDANFNCAMFENGRVKCFGLNGNGQLAIGSTQNIGNQPNQMGKNLKFARIFPPTQSPTKDPTFPTLSPTKTPILNPSKVPINVCNYTSKKKCKKNKLCEWKNNACLFVECLTIIDKITCVANDQCAWKKKSCKSK